MRNMETFEEFGLSEELLRAVKELGFERPMPVQAEVIPYLLGKDPSTGEDIESGDLVALAQTGTGKTAAFGLPLLQSVLGSACTNAKRKETGKETEKETGKEMKGKEMKGKEMGVKGLILSPTRELCMQIAEDLKDYAKYIDGIKVLPVYGGASIRTQIEALRKGCRIIVATPGRLLDLIKRGEADLSEVGTVVMDEADEMLDMGFLDDIDAILASVPGDHKTLLFSATMPEEIEKLSKKYMHDPKEIVIGHKNEGTSTVRHICYTVRASEKYRTLKRIVDFYPRIYGIIFCRTKAETQEISDKLIRDGYNVDALHGDLAQAQRDYVMQRFRLHNIQLLVATDVAARGIDVDDLTHVINYTLPDENEVYTHRSGRTGRAGKTGISISIVNLREKGRIRQIEKSIRQTFETGRIPTGKEICNKQIFNLVDKLENISVNDEELDDILPAVNAKLGWLDKDELVKRLVYLEFHRFLEYYQDDEDFEAETEEKKDKGRRVVELQPGYAKLFINVGHMDNIGPKELLGIISGCIRRKVEVGRIDTFKRYSLFDVREADAEEVTEQLSTLKLHGRSIRVTPATEDQISRGQKPKEPKGGRYKERRRDDRSRAGKSRK